MTGNQWEALRGFREDFRLQCDEWTRLYGSSLAPLQREALDVSDTPPYPIETSIVYNRTLDDLTRESDIRIIVVGDNPGKDEQLAKNRRYLVGQAGKLAEGFFRKNPVLGIDFRQNALILNKTTIHTAKTKDLRWVSRQGDDDIRALLSESQTWMGRHTSILAKELNCSFWVVGYSELREGGLFETYAGELTAAKPPRLRLYQHFSMNRFSIDLREKSDSSLSLPENLEAVGLAHRREVLGW